MQEIYVRHCPLPVIVDDDQYGKVAPHDWFSLRNRNGVPYAHAIIDGRMVKMHRLLLGLTDPKIQGDHNNWDTLDNRHANIRVATEAQNKAHRRRWGSSPYRGVYPSGARWVARISIRGKFTYLGTYETAEEAGLAYDEVAYAAWGVFASLNFPDRISRKAA